MKDLGKFAEVVKARKRAIIVTHDYPDPDCLGSAWGMQFLLRERFGIEGNICWGGFVGRAENRAMVELLRIESIRPQDVDVNQFDLWLMVDTQPKTGNSVLERDSQVDVVIDHHPAQDGDSGAFYEDIRSDLGATATMVAEYLEGFDVEPPANLATALYLGVKTDTQALGRGGGTLDHKYYLDLFEKADHALLARIEYPELRPEYFRILTRGPQRAKVYDNVIVSDLGDVDVPGSVAEMSDLLVRLEDMTLALCTGVFRGMVYFSLRSRDPGKHAGGIARKIVTGLGSAGGHETAAGGQVSLEGRKVEDVTAQLRRELLNLTGLDETQGKTLFPEG